MARTSSLAEQYRTHREVFTLAQELGCTPREAEAELMRRAASARWEEAERRLKARIETTITRFPTVPADAEERREPWWMRD